jgi:hypothetical protein
MTASNNPLSTFNSLNKVAALGAVGDGFRQGAAAIGSGLQQGATMVGEGMQQGAQTGALNALKTDLGDLKASASQTGRGLGNWMGGAGRSLWNAATTPIHAVGAGVGGAFKGAWQNRNLGLRGVSDGMQQGARTGAINALKTDFGDVKAGLRQSFGGVKNVAGGTGRAAWNVVNAPAHAVGSGVMGGVQGGWNALFPKSAFASLEKLAFQAPALLANVAPAVQAYPANRGLQMSDVNKWISQAGPQLPDRPGTHQRALAPAAKPTRIGDMPVLGSDTVAGKGMTMTGPGAGAAAGVPTIQAPAAPAVDLNNEFKKYHGTSFDPNSSMDKGKMEQMQALYKQHGKLSPSLVYNEPYGNKSPYTKSAALSAFAELEKFAQTPRRNLRTAATPVTRPQQYYFTDGSVAPTQSTQPIAIGSGSQVAQPGQGVTVQTRPAANEPIAIGTGNRTVQPGQDVSVRVGPAAAPAVDLNNEFKKYHGTSFDPNSSMDKGKMEQMQALYKQHGKLSPSLVYNKQYGTKSAALSAFAELEKFALAGKLMKGFGVGAKALRTSARAAKDRAADAVKMVEPTRGGIKGIDEALAATDAARSTARAGAGRLQNWGSGALTNAERALHHSKGLQRGINYGVPTVGGAGLLYGSNRMGYGSGREVGADEGYDAAAAAAYAAEQQNNQGYFGNVFNAITGQDPGNAAAVQAMLDQNKSNIIKAILRQPQD